MYILDLKLSREYMVVLRWTTNTISQINVVDQIYLNLGFFHRFLCFLNTLATYGILFRFYWTILVHRYYAGVAFTSMIRRYVSIPHAASTLLCLGRGCILRYHLASSWSWLLDVVLVVVLLNGNTMKWNKKTWPWKWCYNVLAPANATNSS